MHYKDCFKSSDYASELHALRKTTAKDDIANFIADYSLEELAQRGILIHKANKASVYKIRIKDSTSNKGKSSGWRVYYVIGEERLSFIAVYGKTGKNAKENLIQSDVLRRLTNLEDELIDDV